MICSVDGCGGRVVLADGWISWCKEHMEGSAGLNDLQSAWNAAGKAGVTRDARVVGAKDKRKGELSVAENAG